MQFPGSHVLSVEQFDLDALDRLFEVADRLLPVARRRMVTRVLEGAVLGNLFFEASTRTRMSFSSAFQRLGGSVTDTTGFTFSSISKGESLEDTSRVMSGYVDALVMRHPEKGSVGEFARATNIPVINGGDGPGEHPTQALLDVYTMKSELARRGKGIDGAKVVLFGDLKYGRTIHSLVKLLYLYDDMRFVCISPRHLALPPDIKDYVGRRHQIVECFDFPEGLADADVLYATRTQQERISESETLESEVNQLRVDRHVVDRFFGPQTTIMHPLPRDTRPGAKDLSTDLDDDDRLAIFRQADNGIPIRMALFALILDVADELEASIRRARWWSPKRLGPHDAAFDSLGG